MRRGEIAFAEWWEPCLHLDITLEQLASDHSIPDGPDVARIEAWTVAAHQAAWDDDPTIAHEPSDNHKR